MLSAVETWANITKTKKEVDFFEHDEQPSNDHNKIQRNANLLPAGEGWLDEAYLLD